MKIQLFRKLFSTCKTKIPIAQPHLKNIEPFCKKYWGNIDLKQYQRFSKNVSYHEKLHGINHLLINNSNPNEFIEPFSAITKITPKEIIKLTDAEFKILPKTEETITCFRCIGEKPEFFEEFARYKKVLGTKKGEILMMPEYAYATSDINYAKVYLPNNRGIMQIIEIPPESRVSITGHGVNNEVVFPRGSKFECLENKKNDLFTVIKLKYIKPIDYIS